MREKEKGRNMKREIKEEKRKGENMIGKDHKAAPSEKGKEEKRGKRKE